MRKILQWIGYLGMALFLIWMVSNLTFATVNKTSDYEMETINGISLVAPIKTLEEPVFEHLKKINTTWISLMPYAFFRTEKPFVNYDSPRQWWGEKTEGIIVSIQKSKMHQMKVMLKPHLWIGHVGYTGDFTLDNEGSWKIWEDSYRKYILHFAEIADTMQVDMFCFGTELGRAISERPVFWDGLIDTIRTIYSGKLTYAANWDDYQAIPFWKKLDAIGIDAYFPLCKSPTPKYAVMMASWKKHMRIMERFSSEINKPVIFTEYGYRDADYAANEPWTESSDVINYSAQSEAFEALYQSFKGQKWFKGGFIWKWYVDDYYQQHTGPDFTPQGKPAEQIIGKWYKNDWLAK